MDGSQPYGLLITNGEFTAFCDPGSKGENLKPGGVCHDADPIHVRIGPANTGSVRFVNTAFWGPARKVAVVHGSGTVAFSDCNLNSWDCPASLRPGFPSSVCGKSGAFALDFQVKNI